MRAQYTNALHTERLDPRSAHLSHRCDKALHFALGAEAPVGTVVTVRRLVLCHALLLASAWLGASSFCAAQLRWDVGARVGAGKRFAGSAPNDASAPGVGPAAELSLHTALLPLLRVGPSFSGELTPVHGRPLRAHVGLGVEARLFAPVPWPKFRPFAYLGTRVVFARQRASEEVAIGGGGGYLSFPVGLGASVHVAKIVRIIGTLGTDLSVAHQGSLYREDSATFIGYDRIGLRGLLGADLEF